MTFPFQGPKTRINNVWIIFIDPLILGYRFFLNFILFSPQGLGSFFSICLFLPFLQVPSWLPRNCSVETVHLVPHAASLCIPGLSPPPVGPPQTASGPLLPSGGQPLGRNDKPCKSFGFCNKISVAEIYEVRCM